ncbi:MAG TPA: SH3 domain-containing protein [Burkholderiales bacterium]
MRLLALLLLCPLLAIAEPATVIRASELKKEPAADAATIAELPENAALEALERKGGWTRVKSASGEGWVRMLALRFGAPGAAKQGDSGVAQLFNAARTGSSGTQVTTGVRGLDEAMLANAQPNKAELEKMSQFAATPEAAAGFAAKGKLGAHPVEEVK